MDPRHIGQPGSGLTLAGRGPAPPTLHIWNWHQRRLRSQEVLTLHESLNVGLGFLGKGDGKETREGLCWGLGLRIGALSPAPLAAAGPEGGGHDLRGPPLPGLGTLPRAQVSGAGLGHLAAAATSRWRGRAGPRRNGQRGQARPPLRPACQPPRVAPWGRGPSSRSSGVYRHCQPYPLGLVSLGGPRARGLQPPSPHFHLMHTDSA